MFSRGFLLTFTFHCYREGAISKIYPLFQCFFPDFNSTKKTENPEVQDSRMEMGPIHVMFYHGEFGGVFEVVTSSSGQLAWICL